MARKRAAKAETKTAAPLAVNRKARKARKVESSSKPRSNPRSNPPVLTDLTHTILPGFGAYAATRFLQRMVHSVVARRWPKFAKHANAGAGLAAFGGAWLLAHRFKAIEKFHDGILVGSGIAAAQGLVQTYLPKYGWLTSDVNPADVGARKLTAPAPSAMAPAATGGDEYSYLEAQLAEMESPRRQPSRTIRAPRSGTSASGTLKMAAAAAGDDLGLDMDLADALDDGEDLDDLFTGSFSDGTLSAN